MLWYGTDRCVAFAQLESRGRGSETGRPAKCKPDPLIDWSPNQPRPVVAHARRSSAACVVSAVAVAQTRQITLSDRWWDEPTEIAPRRVVAVQRSHNPDAILMVVSHDQLMHRNARTQDPSTWLLITGWEATARERKLLEG